mmetsp:Transcript_9571/g.23296  ORF Transcript_9571/g.23296 Transcript_9571/m.23296 type:complete len:393 (-) Transcript_9571:1158-2336(-)
MWKRCNSGYDGDSTRQQRTITRFTQRSSNRSRWNHNFVMTHFSLCVGNMRKAWFVGLFGMILFASENAFAQTSRVQFVSSMRRPWHSTSPYGRRTPTYGAPPQRDFSSHLLDYDEARKDKRARGWKVDFKRKNIGKMSLTSKLIWMNILAYGLQVFRPSFTAWGIKRSELILEGRQLYRVLTPVFLHGGLGHLGTNMYSLSNIGPDVERLFGTGRYLLTYLMAGIAGNVMSAYQSPVPALGASGAVFGVIGAYTVFLNRNDWLVGSVGEGINSRLMQTIMLNIGLGFMNPAIDNWGHIGGALGGAAMAYYFGPRLYMTELPNGGRMVIDRPLIRLPRPIERIPDRVGNFAGRLARRIRVDRNLQDRPTPPWQQRQRRRPRPDVDGSIKPKRS